MTQIVDNLWINAGTAGHDQVAGIQPVASIATLRALTTTTLNVVPGAIIECIGWATQGDSYQGRLQYVGPATSASFTGTGSSIYNGSGVSNLLTVTGVTGVITIGDYVTPGTDVPAGTVFVGQNSGTTGGAGVYLTNYVVTTQAGALTSTSDNRATQFVDASNRLWKRLWNQTDFPAEWAGILISNADNGQLIGNVPKYTTCRAPIADTLNPDPNAADGAVTFLTYPTGPQFWNVQWRGFSTAFSGAGSMGAPNPNAGAPLLNQIAFDWGYLPSRDIQFAGPKAGTAPIYDMTGTGVSGIEGITIVSQLGPTYGVGLRLGAAPAQLEFTGSISGTTMTVTAIAGTYLGTNYITGLGMPAGVFLLPFGTGGTSGTGGLGTYVLSQDCGTISSQILSNNQGISESVYSNALFSRPYGIAVTGFAFDVIIGSPALHTFITGLDAFTLKQGQIALYISTPNGFDSGESLLFSRGMLAATVSDACTSTSGLAKATIDTTSFDYNHRNGNFATAFMNMRNIYHETNSSVTTGNLYVVASASRLVFDDCTSFFGLPYASPDLILIFDTSQVNFDDSLYFDSGAIPFYGATTRQFINTVVTDNIFGNIRGCNGINQVPAVSPAGILNPDWQFASGGLTLYPSSTGCSVQTSTVPPGATNAILMAGTAAFVTPEMEVTPGMIVMMSLLDQLSGTVSSLGGTMVFYTQSGVQISSVAVSSTCGAPGWYAGGTLAPNFTTTARSGWTLQQFAFRAPPGAGYTIMTLNKVGSGSYYFGNLELHGKNSNG